MNSKSWISAYSNLAKVILPVLRDLKEKRMSDGMVDPKDLYPSMREESYSDQWDFILDKMIYSFNEVVEDHPNEPGINNPPEDRVTYYYKLQQGFVLFGKYYMSLWS